MQNKPLAQTFRLIARHGPDCFYKYMPQKGCDIAKGIVEGQKFNRPQAPNGKGGSMTYADLENYQAVERAPVEGSYRGYPIKAAMPPSSRSRSASMCPLRPSSFSAKLRPTISSWRKSR